MSRLKKIKEVNKKQLTKATMLSLTLILALGIGNSMTTHAWFVDSETIENNLIVSMGKLKTNITDSFSETGLRIGNTISKEFTITNNGTLDQFLTLSVDKLSKNNEKYINYIIEFDNYKGKKIKSINGEQILNKKLSIRDIDNNIVTLEPNESLKATAYITIDENMPVDLINSFVKNPLKFDLKIKATQANNQNYIQGWGFSHSVSQSNTLQFDEVKIPNKENHSGLEVNKLPSGVVETPSDEVYIPKDEIQEQPKEEIEIPTQPESLDSLKDNEGIEE